MRQQETRLPDFILIGAQKSGTTALAKNLRRHPSVHIAGTYPSWIEMHFFDHDEKWARGVPWYESHFDRPHLLQGEKTPNYLSNAVAIERMASTVPDAKLVALLRNPVDRAYSQWNHFNQQVEQFAKLGWEVLPFEAALERSQTQPSTIFGSLLQKGEYARQLTKVLQHFEREQLLIGIAERFRRSPGEEYDRVLDFLGLGPANSEFGNHHVREYQRPMDPGTAGELERHFAHHNEQLFELLGHEIPEWRESAARATSVFIERDRPFGTGYDVCFVTTCMGRLEHLKQSLPRMLAQRNACALVVDYSCPQGAGDWVEKEFDPEKVHVVRVNGETRYNAAKARNAGALVPASRWVAMIDADTLLPEHFLDADLPEFCDGRYYVMIDEPPVWSALPDGFRELYGLVIARPADLRRVAGYDEVLRGYGGEDVDLRARLRDAGLEEVRLTSKLPVPIAHADDDRTKYHQVGDKRLANAINVFYGRVKRDMARLSGAQPKLQTRQQIYDVVNNAFRHTVANGKPARVELSLPTRAVEKGTSMGVQLVYSVQIAPGTFELTDALSWSSPLPAPNLSSQPRDNPWGIAPAARDVESG